MKNLFCEKEEFFWLLWRISPIMEFIPFFRKKSHFVGKFHTIEFFSFGNYLIKWETNSIIGDILQNNLSNVFGYELQKCLISF